MGNFAFTLYEVFGYLFPGGVALAGFFLLYWALFVPSLPLKIAFQPGPGTWIALILASYLLGHAVQAVGNLLLKGAEAAVLGTGGTAPTEIRKSAAELTAELLGINPEEVSPVWIFKTLDEQSVQTGEPGDREMFVYREGFYRGSAIALFFLTAMVIIRACFSGSSKQFPAGVFNVSHWQLITTALITGIVGWLFVRRYHRFAAYSNAALKGRSCTTPDHPISLHCSLVSASEGIRA